MPSFHFIVASTSGHTAFVVDTLVQFLQRTAPGTRVTSVRAEHAGSADFRGDGMLILCSGTWNTGGIEGQVNPHMHALLTERADAVDLQGRPCTCISLGDERYRYRTRCTEHLLRYIRAHHGVLAVPPLILVNEPYDQVEKIERFGERLLSLAA